MEGVRQLFDEIVVGSLATINDDGSPRTVPVHLFYDGEAVYWFSAEDTVHSLNIDRDGRASIALWSPDVTAGARCVYVTGIAEKLNAIQSDNARELVRLRLGAIPGNFITASAYRLPLGALDEAKSRGNCWYFYTEKI